MNTIKTTVLRLPEPLWQRQKSWLECLKWTFAFGAVVLSGVLYVSS